MSAGSGSRFTSQNKTTQERISSNTVGLVALSDFRKRRAEVLEQQEREAREAVSASSSAPAPASASVSASASAAGTPVPNTTPDRSLTSTPAPDGLTNDSHQTNPGELPAPPPKKKKKAAAVKKSGGAKLSFGGDDEEDAGSDDQHGRDDKDGRTIKRDKAINFKPNSSVAIVPRSLTKSALRREATERELLRREFLARQDAVKATEIAIPFVFYDGTNIPGGTVRVKKGDFVWVFLDKSRRLGADRGVGDRSRSLREWARIGVDDLLLVRGNVIIPHHYDFLFFIMNKTVGPSGKPLFGYSAEAPNTVPAAAGGHEMSLSNVTPTGAGLDRNRSDTSSLEGASDDPSYTKVVDRRWYERNRHIYPATLWQDFDPEKDYQTEIRRDLGGNTFFYS